MNKVILSGNLCKDPELRITPSGKSVCSFSVATNERMKQEDGQYKDVPTFHNIVAWGSIGEAIAKFFHKGSKILIDGRISNRSYEDKQTGVKKYISEVILNSFEFLERMPVQEGNTVEQIKEAFPEAVEVGNIPF